MAQSFKETAHLKTDTKKLSDNWMHVFDRENCGCEECRPEGFNILKTLNIDVSEISIPIQESK